MSNLPINRFEWLERMAADSRLHSTAVRVALVISRYINRESGKAWPSIKTIAAASGTPERTVKHAISSLCEAGYLEKRRGGFSKSNIYVMAGITLSDGNDNPISSQAMDCPNDDDSGAMDCPNDSSSGAMDCPSVGQWVAPRSGNGLPTNPLIEPSIEPIRIDISPPTPSSASPSKGKVALEPDFEAFFAAYPRKVSKGTARKAWTRAVKQAEPAAIIAAAERYAQERRSEDPRFTKYPASWLNAESWNDEPPPRANPGTLTTGRASAKERTAAAIKHMLDADHGDFQ